MVRTAKGVIEATVLLPKDEMGTIYSSSDRHALVVDNSIYD